MFKDQEDLDQRELTTSELLSLSESKMMLESTLSEEKLKKETRPSTKHQRSKD